MNDQESGNSVRLLGAIVLVIAVWSGWPVAHWFALPVVVLAAVLLRGHRRFPVLARAARKLAILTGALCGAHFLYLAWPTDVWLLLAAAVIAVLHGSARRLVSAQWEERDREPARRILCRPSPRQRKGLFGEHGRDLGRRIAWRAVIAMRNAGLAAFAGIALVCAVQVALHLLTSRASKVTVFACEVWLTRAQRWMSAALHVTWPTLFAVLLVLVATTAVWPHLRLVLRFARLRRLGTRLLIAVTAASSFTFFTNEHVADSEPAWVAQWRDEAQRAIDTADQARREMVAAAWVEQTTREMPAPIVADLRELFKQAAARGQERAAILRIVADGVATTAPRVASKPAGEAKSPPSGDEPPRAAPSSEPREEEPREANAAAREGKAAEGEGSAGAGAAALEPEEARRESAFERVRLWLRTPTMQRRAAVSLDDLHTCEREASRAQETAREATHAAAEAVATIVGEAVAPGEVHELSRVFAESMVQKVSDASLKEVPRQVYDLNTAREWVRGKVRQGRSRGHEEAPFPKWEWRVRAEQVSAEVPARQAMTSVLDEASRRHEVSRSQSSPERSSETGGRSWWRSLWHSEPGHEPRPGGHEPSPRPGHSEPLRHGGYEPHSTPRPRPTPRPRFVPRR